MAATASRWATSQTGTRPLDRSLAWLVSYGSRGNQSPMNSPQTELQAITSQLATVAESLSTLQQALATLQQQQPTTTVSQSSDQLIPFTAFLMVELTPHFGSDVSKTIVDCLEDCRKIRGYHYFSKMYKFTAGDIHKRELLLMVRCTYQLKFSIGKHDPRRYSLRSLVKKSKSCPHCGNLANALYDRLVQEGLW